MADADGTLTRWKDRAMKLLFVIDSLGSGGAQRQMVTLAVGLAARGHTVAFFVYYPEFTHFKPALDAASIPVFHEQKQSRFAFNVPFALRRHIKSQNYDAVLAFLDTPNVYVELLRLSGIQTPIIASERSADVAGQPLKRSIWLRRQLHRFADHVTVNSHHQRQRMEREFPWLQPKISTIVNGLDLTQFSPEALPTTNAETVLLSVSTVVRGKNPQRLAKALALLQQQQRPVPRIKWAGRIPDQAVDDSYQQTNVILEAAGLTHMWDWLGRCEDIPQQMQAADAVIHPSLLEGFPNAICEALACGAPVLAADIGDHRWLLGDGKHGVVFDPTDVTAIAAAIQQFMTLSPAAIAQMQTAAREFACETLAVDTYVTHYETLLTRLIA